MGQVLKTAIGEIEYNIIGSGKPVLFLHGGHSNSNDSLWHKGFDPKQFQLIIPSRPGYGNTPLSSFCQPIKAAELMITLLDELNIDQVIVVGVSAGGLTAIQLAAKFGIRVKKLVLISAVTKRWLLPNDMQYKTGKILFAPGIESVTWRMTKFFFNLFPGAMTRMMLKQLSSKVNVALRSEDITELKNMIRLQSSGKGFSCDLDQDLDSKTIYKIECPSLIVHSANDKAVKLEFAEYAHSKIRGSELKVYNNSWGHLLWIGEGSAEAIRDVNQFVSGN